jgi:plasmid replication initiation protein
MAKKKKKLPSSIIVTQANQLVEARYNLSLGEQRLILAMIAKIQPDDEDFKPYQISIGELAEFMGISKNSMYQECQKITKRLLERVVEINEATGLLQIGWVSSAKYIDGKGMVNLAFDPLLKPYLLQLKGNFTSSKFELMMSFKSQYTVRIYNLIKQYELLKVRELELELLRNILGIEKAQYSLYSNFKKDILESTKKELNEKADVYFEYDEIKYGRRVGAIRFHIFKRKEIISASVGNQEGLFTEPFAHSNEAPSLINELVLIIPEQYRLRKTILSAIEIYEKKHGYDYVRRNILYCNVKADKSYAGFLNKALKADWGYDWDLNQQEPLRKKPLEVWERHGFSNLKEYNEFMYRKQMEGYERRVIS